MDGELSVEKAAEGYRWVFVTDGGAMYVGPQIFKTRATALKHGREWVEQQ